MSHRLEIPDALYDALKEAADASGLTPLGWIAAHLPQASTTKGAERDSSLRTLADLFAGRVGRIQSGGKERLSERCEEKFTDYLEDKRRAEHL